MTTQIFFVKSHYEFFCGKRTCQNPKEVVNNRLNSKRTAISAFVSPKFVRKKGVGYMSETFVFWLFLNLLLYFFVISYIEEFFFSIFISLFFLARTH